MEKLVFQSHDIYFDTLRKGKTVCIGSKDNCSYLTDEGAICVSPKSIIEESTISTIVNLFVESAKISLDIIEQIKIMDNLGCICTPFHLLEEIVAALPQKVHSITLTESSKAKKIKSEFNFDNITALMLNGHSEIFQEWVNLGLLQIKFSNLRYFSSPVDANQAVINFIKEMKFLKHLELETVKNSSVVDLGDLSIEFLEIQNLGKMFDFSSISNFKSLASLTIRGAKGVLDLNTLTECLNLQEVILSDCKKIENVDALLRCELLKNIEILDCGRPIKGELKQQFENHGFALLDLKYS